MYYWAKSLIDIDLFYKKYNFLIDLIKKSSLNYKLTYINHPSSQEEQDYEINRLNLDGFEIIKNINCEYYCLNSKNLIISFSIISTCILTLNQMGIQSYSLSKLFSDKEISLEYKNRIFERLKILPKYGSFYLDNLNEISLKIQEIQKFKPSNFNDEIYSDYREKLSI